MKRLHVHVRVHDIPESVRFYAALFASEPVVTKPDYAKWMLDDPRVNFAISTRENVAAGIEHLGIQVETETELAEIYARLDRAERPVLKEAAATCCYAKSDKQWISDPQGVAWETFLTHGGSTTYGGTGAVGKLNRLSAETPEPPES
jgi:catechol 2,3-dioxygenase-like lactoylglutathione lyase family enzyme